jgi:hypothetical protein
MWISGCGQRDQVLRQVDGLEVGVVAEKVVGSLPASVSQRSRYGVAVRPLLGVRRPVAPVGTSLSASPRMSASSSTRRHADPDEGKYDNDDLKPCGHRVKALVGERCSVSRQHRGSSVGCFAVALM